MSNGPSILKYGERIEDPGAQDTEDSGNSMPDVNEVCEEDAGVEESSKLVDLVKVIL